MAETQTDDDRRDHHPLLETLDVRDTIAMAALGVFYIAATIAGFSIAAWAGWAALSVSSLIIAAIMGFQPRSAFFDEDE